MSKSTDIPPLNCRHSGHPCGTDTWMAGDPCRCEACQYYLEHERFRSALQAAERERDEARAELSEEKELRHVTELDRDLWHGVATRKSDKITAAIGDGKPVAVEVAAGYLQIVAALARQWISQVPRFMELTLEDSEGQMLLTVKKAEQPSPVQLLLTAEQDRDSARLEAGRLAAEVDSHRQRWADLERIQDRQLTFESVAMELAEAEGKLVEVTGKLVLAEAEVGRLQSDRDDWCKQYNASNEREDVAQEELARLREALEFYGAAETWRGIGGIAEWYQCREGGEDFEVIDGFEVGGKRAREALGK